MRFPPKFTLRPEQLERFLVPSSLLYLALPNIIFCIGWLQWYWALLGVALLAVALIESTHMTFRHTTEKPSPPEGSPLLTFQHLLFLLLVSLLWLTLSGVGGVGYQRSDWIKHEGILRDLIGHDWPVVYDFYTTPLPLVYYFAYYLPAAAIGKIGGWGMAQAALFVWTFVGLNLAILWFWLLVRPLSKVKSYAVFVIFIFFSGLDLIGRTIGNVADLSINTWESLERWVFELEYSANTNLLYLVPNQALAGWIATGLVIYAILHLRNRRITWLPLGLSLLWSPFLSFGLGLYLLLDFFADTETWPARLRRYLSWSNLCGLFLLFLTGFFFASKIYDVGPSIRGDIPHGFFHSLYAGSMLGAAGVLAIFWLLEVGVFLFLLGGSVTSEERLWRWLFFTTVVYLLLLPLYKLGMQNDWVMRASIPALFCLALLVARSVQRSTVPLPIRMSLVTVLVVGAATTLVEAVYQIRGIYRQGTVFSEELSEEESNAGPSIVEIYETSPKHLLQYIGSYHSPFFEYFAREPHWTNASEPKRYIAFADQRILFERSEFDKHSGLQPGEEVQLINSLYVFYSAIDKNYNISLRLVAEDGKELWKEQGWPQNRPTSIWAPSHQWFDTRTITLPADAPFGFYRLDLSFVEPDSHDLLPAIEVPSGRPMGEVVPITYLSVGEIRETPAYSFPQPAQLGGKMVLLGMSPTPIEMASRSLSPDESLTIELFWQATAAMDVDYTGFVHLIAPDGTLSAQDDHLPRHGFLPTHIWRVGDVISDHYTIVVPADATPGSYSLVAGIYDLQSGARLPVQQNGVDGEDTILLGHVDVR